VKYLWSNYAQSQTFKFFSKNKIPSFFKFTSLFFFLHLYRTPTLYFFFLFEEIHFLKSVFYESRWVIKTPAILGSYKKCMSWLELNTYYIDLKPFDITRHAPCKLLLSTSFILSIILFSPSPLKCISRFIHFCLVTLTQISLEFNSFSCPLSLTLYFTFILNSVTSHFILSYFI